MEKPGALMLAPVYKILFGKFFGDGTPSLELTEDQVAISYKIYKSGKADDRQTIVDENLTPGIMTIKIKISRYNDRIHIR